jgi:hypothetical protein
MRKEGNEERGLPPIIFRYCFEVGRRPEREHLHMLEEVKTESDEVNEEEAGEN